MEPFQVMCVNVPADWPEFCKLKNRTHPDVGDICTVVSIEPHFYYPEITMYMLAEHGNQTLYCSQHFAILPSRSADEMHEEQKEAIINLEHQIV